MSEHNNEHIDQLITSFLSKGATPEEQEELLAWIEADIDNKGYYKQAYKAWLSGAQVCKQEPERKEQALQQVNRKLSDLSVVERRRQSEKARKVAFPWRIFKYAAAIVVLMIISNMITWYFTKQHEPQISEMVYEAHYGSRAFAILPDSTKVWLNSGSKLNVHQGYNFHERQVELIGEAYFEVRTNPEKPFIVSAGELSIKATGTVFNVKAYPEEKQITTTLVEGVVFIEGVDNQDKKFTLKMKPNQSISYTRQEIAESVETNVVAKEETGQKTDNSLPLIPAVARQVKPEAMTSWTKDRWIIDNDDFGSLAVKLERRYNVEIHFESEELKDYRFTGIIERETLEQMFEAFRYTIPLKYTIDKGVVTLTLDDKLKVHYDKTWKHE